MGRQRVEVGLAFAGFVVIGLGGGAAGVLLPAQIDFYRIDKSVIGLLFFAFSAGYLLAGATNGWLLRRLGVRGELVLGAASFGVTALGAGLQPGFGGLLGVTVVSGFGGGIIDSGLNSYLAALPGRPCCSTCCMRSTGSGRWSGRCWRPGCWTPACPGARRTWCSRRRACR
ncbi:MAG TPA: hypothetical protein VGX25_29585 [Actinophytocola sp.]|uniref:MFS transporter n=1 Tax=Actinophytocola sp. TaxID=1872138 RepID=UPI002DDDBA6A|nr:hypothetical protein [Actinophytocola sp.]HEV2783558.1 hypothetical protein [Actinophytocola sp.]